MVVALAESSMANGVTESSEVGPRRVRQRRKTSNGKATSPPLPFMYADASEGKLNGNLNLARWPALEDLPNFGSEGKTVGRFKNYYVDKIEGFGSKLKAVRFVNVII